MNTETLKFTHINTKVNLSFGVICDDQVGLKIDSDLKSIENGYIFRRKITNATSKNVKLYGLFAYLRGLSFDNIPSDDYYYCNENGRLFSTLTLPVDYDRTGVNACNNDKLGVIADTFWADPEVISNKILNSVYQPFPAILISNYNVKNGLVCGSLSQDCFYHNYELSHEDRNVLIKINSEFKDVDYRILAPNESVEDVLYFGSIDTADDFNRLFDEYNSVLRLFLTNNRGASQANRHSLVWDSWNDGIYRNVSEEMLLKEAASVKKFLPCVEWFQLDDGYSAFCHDNPDKSAHGMGTCYEENHGIDLKKFPDGLKGYTQKVKATGLKPAIWIGAVCPSESQICKENPDWFLDYSYRFSDSRVLDVSKPEVREYMTKTVEWFVSQGIEGIKHDFWSYAFEDSHNLLSHKEKSGYEYREWWCKYIRSVVGENGYIGSSVDMSMGNPFIGKYFNNYRFGIDIGSGKWINILTTFYWGICVLSSHSGDLFIPNCDSIGFLRSLNDVDYMFAVNFAVISRSFVETSGIFSAVDEKDERLSILQRATKYLNNGENVYFAKFDYRKKGQSFPNILYLKSHFDSPEHNENYRTVALFNGSEESVEIEFSAGDIELDGANCRFTNYWTDEKTCARLLKTTLKPHESRLYLVDLIEE